MKDDNSFAPLTPQVQDAEMKAAMSHGLSREYIQKAYIRVCGDSNFKMEMIQAAHFTAKLLGISAIEVWVALTFAEMERIASGLHPCLLMPQYADDWTRARAKTKQAALLAEPQHGVTT